MKAIDSTGKVVEALHNKTLDEKDIADSRGILMLKWRTREEHIEALKKIKKDGTSIVWKSELRYSHYYEETMKFAQQEGFLRLVIRPYDPDPSNEPYITSWDIEWLDHPDLLD